MDSILKDLSPILQLLMVMAIFAFLPFMFVCMTSFLRYAIVFGFLKQALGAQQIPPPIVSGTFYYSYFLYNGTSLSTNV